MDLAYVGIKEKEIDRAGKWRVWVILSNGDLIMFKFQNDPTDEEIEQVGREYVDVLNNPPTMPPPLEEPL